MASAQPKSPKEDMADLQAEAREEEKTRGGSLWVEIRVPTDSDLERRNLEPVYNRILTEAHGPEDVFEFVVAGMESSEGEGLKARYFMKAPDHERKRGLWNSLDGRGVNVHEVEDPFDFSVYDREARFEMEDDFAMPLMPAEEIERGNFPRIPEQLASAVKDGGVLRVVIRRDDDARNHIQKFINREEGKGGDPLKVLEGMFDNLFAGRTYDGVPETRREKPLREEETKYSRLAKDRRDKNLAHCEIRAYGNENQVRRISKSFGFELNNIRELDRGEPESNRKKIEREIRDKLGTALDAAEDVSEVKRSSGTNLEEFEIPWTEEDREELGSELSDISEAFSDASEAVSDASEALENYQEGDITPDRSSGARSGLLKGSLLLPFLLPVVLAYIGFWNPLSVLGFSSSLGLIRSLWPVFVPVGVAVGSWLWLFGKKGRPIILTLHELSVMGSLPSRPQTLPVERETPSVPSSGEEELAGGRSEEGTKSEREGKKGGESKNE